MLLDQFLFLAKWLDLLQKTKHLLKMGKKYWNMWVYPKPKILVTLNPLVQCGFRVKNAAFFESQMHQKLVSCLAYQVFSDTTKALAPLENFNNFVLHCLLCIWMQFLSIFMSTKVLSNICTQLDGCQWSMVTNTSPIDDVN